MNDQGNAMRTKKPTPSDRKETGGAKFFAPPFLFISKTDSSVYVIYLEKKECVKRKCTAAAARQLRAQQKCCTYTEDLPVESLSLTVLTQEEEDPG